MQDEGSARREAFEEPGLYVEPVQLQVVCYRLWENHHAAGPIDEALVRGEAGDVQSALADFYAAGVAAAVAKVPNLAERRIRDWCEQRLITPQGTRGQVQGGDESEPSLPADAINALIDARIVRDEQRRDLTWHELAHDRLIEPVRGSNSAWRDDHLQPWQRKAEVHAKTGLRDLLLVGPELEAAKAWALENSDVISAAERNFLTVERRARRWRGSRSRRLFDLLRKVVAASVVGMFALTMVAVRSCNQAEEQRVAADNQKKIADDERHAADNQKKIADDERNKAQQLLVGQSLSRGVDLCLRDKVDEGLHWLVRGLEQWVPLAGHDDSPEPLLREEIAAWSLETHPLKAILASDASILAVAFSPDGRSALTGSARQHGAAVGRGHRPAARTGTAARGAVIAVAFSPDGRSALTGSNDNTARLWDAATGQPRGPALKHGDWVRAVAFSPDGRRAHRELRQDGAAVGRGHRPARGPALQHEARSTPWRSAPTAAPRSPAVTTGRRGCGTRPPASRADRPAA